MLKTLANTRFYHEAQVTFDPFHLDYPYVKTIKMHPKVRNYISEICKYYGFAFSIPIGQYFLKLVFDEKVTIQSFLFALIIFIIGTIIFGIGVIIMNKDGEE
jgi:hypothetical protein